MAMRLRRRSPRVTPTPRRRRCTNRAASENQIVDLTCTGDDEYYDLTVVPESPVVVDGPSPIVISDTPVGNQPLRQTVNGESTDLHPLQLPDSETETEELPACPFVVPKSQNSGSGQVQPSCPICFDSFAQIRARNIQLVSTKCGHVFCQQCIDDLLRSASGRCPTCRKAISKKTVHPIYF